MVFYYVNKQIKKYKKKRFDNFIKPTYINYWQNQL